MSWKTFIRPFIHACMHWFGAVMEMPSDVSYPRLNEKKGIKAEGGADMSYNGLTLCLSGRCRRPSGLMARNSACVTVRESVSVCVMARKSQRRPLLGAWAPMPNHMVQMEALLHHVQ